MIQTIVDEMAANPPPEFRTLIELLKVVVDHSSYNDLLRRALGDRPDYDKLRALREHGMFRSEDFVMLLHTAGNGEGTTLFRLPSLLKRLLDWGLIHDNGGLGAHFAYFWQRDRIRAFLEWDIVDNILLGPAFIAQKYRASVPAVFVEKEGDKSIGTCFAVKGQRNAKAYVLVTAKHCVNPEDGITFEGLSEPQGAIYVPTRDAWVLHPELDLALLPVECEQAPPSIFLFGTPTILSKTVTLGYPRIARTDGPYLLAHGGELNAVVNTYHGEERLIISNVAAPGNSGGPVLDEAGLCVGIVVDAFETKHQGGTDKVSSAIPAAQIFRFVDPYCKQSL